MIGLAVLAVATNIAPAGGQYVLTRSSISGGGGRVAGGPYELFGTIGQADAGTVTGGDYILSGGLWPSTSVCPASSPAALLQIEESLGGPLVDLTGNRIIGLFAGDPGRTQGIRIRFTSLPFPWSEWNGAEMWVTNLREVCDLPGIADPDNPQCGMIFKVAGLTCDATQADFRDWTLEAPVYIEHPGIVPNGLYDVQLVDRSCDLGAEGSFSAVLEVPNSMWGDIGGQFDPGAGLWTAPDGVVGIPTDILSMIAAFGNQPGNPTKLRADIEPCILDFKINISDITFALDGFRGLPYPFAPGGGDCPPDPCGE